MISAPENAVWTGQKKKAIAKAGPQLGSPGRPCICGKSRASAGQTGSGTVFFSGCTLCCCYCQNYRISSENFGKEITATRLSEIFLELQDKKAQNINLVNPTHYAPWIIEVLRMIKKELKIPVVYNTSGYETVEMIKALQGYVDIYMPDLKYLDPKRAERYSSCPGYFEAASEAILEMKRQVPEIVMDENGMLKRGLLIRHLVLPGGRKDSMDILTWIAGHLPADEILVSIMAQYTPYYKSTLFPEIDRRLTTFEYQTVLDKANELGIKGYMQQKKRRANGLYPGV